MSKSEYSTEEPTVTEYLNALKGSPKFGPQVVCHKTFDEGKGRFGKELPELDASLISYLQINSVDKLYTHQTESIKNILQGKDVLVSTPTASGKTFIYNLPVLHEVAQNKDSSSLYLFPLKALARDQFDSLLEIFNTLPEETKRVHSPLAAIYDGDSTPYQRQKIKKQQPPILFTNPEMLHLSLLPYHHNWQKFFSRLKYVVIDEVHSYRGVLGSHMAWVLRRLMRIAEHYGANPQFIMLSATVGNPAQLGELLVNRKVTTITDSGAPKSEKHIVFINPWDSPAFTACQLLEASIKRGLRTIVYTQSRKMTELINLWVTPNLGELKGKISSYRAGFLAEERRAIEEKLFSGELLGVISTSALELGIDIGDLDICILVGYPGSIMATMQRGGRVGRKNKPSVVILIAQEDALDQHFMRKPDDFFNRESEKAILNPYNKVIMKQHLHCCAAELEISTDTFGDKEVTDALSELVYESNLLLDSEGFKYYPTRKYPQRHISLRGGGNQLTIINFESGEIIGEADSLRAMKECHEGAVYLHRGLTWLIESLDFVNREIAAVQKKPHFYTRALTEKDTSIIEEVGTKKSFGTRVSWGRVRVIEQVTGYQKINKSTQKVIANVPLDFEKQEFETEGLWLYIPDQIKEKMECEKMHFMGAIHALEHAMISLYPLFVLCDRNDIGGISCPYHEQTEAASIFIYDGYSGGVGLSSPTYKKIDSLLKEVEKVISACECETGCPSCVHSPKCGSGNRPIDKEACLYLVRAIIASDKSKVVLEDFSSKNVKAEPKLIKKGLNALPERFGVFDLETQFSAEDVGGWHQVEKMKMSLGVVYDSYLDEYVTYLEDEVDSLVEHLCQLDLVVGFNNIRFDNRVLDGYGLSKQHNVPTLDLLIEVKNRLSYRLSLQRLAEATLNSKKSADGLQALEWYKEGRIDLIQKYCKKDVEITKNIFLFALENEHLLFFNKAQKKVRLPLDLSSRIDALLKN